MVSRANHDYPGLGGHISSFASSAKLYDVAFNHFFRGKSDGSPGDAIYIQGHAAPCIYARAFLERRMDETDLAIAFNDIDFCLRVRERGLLNVFTPWCEAWHHESLSRGYEDTEEKKERFWREVEYFRERHAAVLEAGDPFYNPNLTLWHENFDLDDAVRRPVVSEGG